MTDFYKGKLDEADNLYIKYGLLQKWNPIKCEYNGQKPCGRWCKKFGEPHEEYFGPENDEDEEFEDQKYYRTIVSICYDICVLRNLIYPIVSGASILNSTMMLMGQIQEERT